MRPKKTGNDTALGYPIFVKTLSREQKTWILSGESLDNNTICWISVGVGLDKSWTRTWIGLTLDKHWIKIGLSLDWTSSISPTNHSIPVPKSHRKALEEEAIYVIALECDICPLDKI